MVEQISHLRVAYSTAVKLRCTSPVYHLRFVEAVGRLGHSVDAPISVKSLLRWPTPAPCRYRGASKYCERESVRANGGVREAFWLRRLGAGCLCVLVDGAECGQSRYRPAVRPALPPRLRAFGDGLAAQFGHGAHAAELGKRGFRLDPLRSISEHDKHVRDSAARYACAFISAGAFTHSGCSRTASCPLIPATSISHRLASARTVILADAVADVSRRNCWGLTT